MNVERFDKVINKIKGHTEHVYFHLMGEPFLNPNLEKFLESVNELKNQIGDIADKAQKCSNDFVDDMDKADGYLY